MKDTLKFLGLCSCFAVLALLLVHELFFDRTRITITVPDNTAASTSADPLTSLIDVKEEPSTGLPATMTIGWGPTQVVIDLNDGSASYSCALPEAAHTFWDAVAAMYPEWLAGRAAQIRVNGAK